MTRQLGAGQENVKEVGARILTPALAQQADLVLCMTRDQRRDVSEWSRGDSSTHALAGFSDVAAKILMAPPDPLVEADLEASVVSHVARVAALHRDEVHARLGDDTDVAEAGRGGSAHTHTAQRLRQLFGPVIKVLRGEAIAGY